MAEKFGLDLTEVHPFSKLQASKNNLRSGKLGTDWYYRFHGDACQFEHRPDGQILDVKINRWGNFGTLSDFYLYRFIETTPALAETFRKIESEPQFYDMIAQLEANEIIIDIGPPFFKTRVLNRPKPLSS